MGLHAFKSLGIEQPLFPVNIVVSLGQKGLK